MSTSPTTGAGGNLVRHLGTGLGIVLFAALLWWGPLAGGDAIRPKAAPPTATPTAASLPPAKPKRLSVPALRIDAKVIPVDLSPDRALDPPRDPRLLGWWNGSVEPGADSGSTLVAGHTVHTGGGALDKMTKLKSGSKIALRTREGKLIYEVDRVVTYSKEQLARKAERVFDQDGPARLVLVTCKDWNGQFYESNVIAFAHVVDAKPAEPA